MDEFVDVHVNDHDWLFFIRTLCLGVGFPLVFFILHRILSLCFISPFRAYRKLQTNGFTGPPPSFPLGSITEMRDLIRKDKEEKMVIKMDKKEMDEKDVVVDTVVSHDIHSTVFPYFSKWISSYGKVFVYWLGTEPFLYIGDPEFLKKMSAGITAKHWGKPSVFKHDRTAIFGYNGLVMIEGDEWARHRHTIAPALSTQNLKGMAPAVVDIANNMINRWSNLIASGKNDIEVDKDITIAAAEIIATTIFGIDDDNGRRVFEKLREVQITLFRTDRLVGVPFSRVLYMKQTQRARRLGKEMDELLVEMITSRSNRISEDEINGHKQDMLWIMLSNKDQKQLTTIELVDECKTFFFGGHETTALALTWTLLLLALNPKWQHQLREEIKQVMGDGAFDPNMLDKLHKMGWVLNEVLRLYSAPNAQRQSREDIVVNGWRGNNSSMIIPSGTNMWIDIVGIHHDPSLWGEDVNEFKPERFRDDPIHGGCKHKMGYLPFGFGGRMCIGRSLTMLEYRVVLALILTRFSFSLSPNYSHSPTVMFSLRPDHGLPLILQPV